MREEQVQNAVKFLSHPYRRSFLERKGLTNEEIDEDFCLVPDPPQNVSNAQPDGTNQDGPVKSSSNVQPQASTPIMQPSAAAPAWYRFHWHHALLVAGILALLGLAVGGYLALSGAGTVVFFQTTVFPWLKSWICKVVFKQEEGSAKKMVSKPSLEQEAAAGAAKAAAAAVADVARASQKMLLSKSEEEKYFKELMNLIEMQVQEMKSMSNAIQKLEAMPEAAAAIRQPKKPLKPEFPPLASTTSLHI